MFVNGDAAIMMATCSGLNAIGELARWNLDFGFHVAPSISKSVENTAAFAMATGEDVYNAILPMFSDFHQIVMDYMAKVVNEPEYTADQATADMAADINECIEMYNLSK